MLRCAVGQRLLCLLHSPPHACSGHAGGRNLTRGFPWPSPPTPRVGLSAPFDPPTHQDHFPTTHTTTTHLLHRRCRACCRAKRRMKRTTRRVAPQGVAATLPNSTLRQVAALHPPTTPTHPHHPLTTTPHTPSYPTPTSTVLQSHLVACDSAAPPALMPSTPAVVCPTPTLQTQILLHLTPTPTALSSFPVLPHPQPQPQPSNLAPPHLPPLSLPPFSAG